MAHVVGAFGLPAAVDRRRWPNVVAIVTRARILRKCFAFPLNKCVNGVCSYMPVDIIYVPESAEEC